jgi:hypothetical protein
MTAPVRGGRGPELRVMLAHGADDLPVRFSERADAGVLREGLRERLRPQRKVADQAVFVKQSGGPE